MTKWCLQLILFAVILFLSAGGSASLSLVQLGDDGLDNVLHLLLLSLQVLGGGVSIIFKPLDLFVNYFFNLTLLVIAQLATEFLLVIELVLQAIGIALKLVPSLDLALELGILLSKLLGVIDHLLDVLRAKPVVVIGDGDLLLVAGTLVLSRHDHDTVGVNLEGDLDLRNTSGCWGNTSDVELAEHVVVLGHGPLSLVHLDGHGVLVVGSGGEDLALLGGDDGVSGDELGHDSSNSLDSKSQGVNIKKHDVSGVLLSREDAGLNSSSVGNSLIRVDSLAGLLAIKVLLDKLLDLGNPGGTSDKNYLVNVLLGKVSILKNLLDRFQSSLEQIHVQFLKLGSGQSLREILALKQRLDFNPDLVSSRQSSLGLLTLSPQLLDSANILSQVLSFLPLVELDEVFHHPLVKVLTSKMGVSVGGDDLEHSIIDGQEGHIKGTASEIKHKDVLLSLLLVHAVSDGSSGGLVDDSHGGHASDNSGVLGGLSLGVIEVGGDGDPM